MAADARIDSRLARAVQAEEEKEDQSALPASLPIARLPAPASPGRKGCIGPPARPGDGRRLAGRDPGALGPEDPRTLGP